MWEGPAVPPATRGKTAPKKRGSQATKKRSVVAARVEGVVGASRKMGHAPPGGGAIPGNGELAVCARVPGELAPLGPGVCGVASPASGAHVRRGVPDSSWIRGNTMPDQADWGVGAASDHTLSAESDPCAHPSQRLNELVAEVALRVASVVAFSLTASAAVVAGSAVVAVPMATEEFLVADVYGHLKNKLREGSVPSGQFKSMRGSLGTVCPVKSMHPTVTIRFGLQTRGRSTLVPLGVFAAGAMLVAEFTRGGLWPVELVGVIAIGVAALNWWWGGASGR